MYFDFLNYYNLDTDDDYENDREEDQENEEEYSAEDILIKYLLTQVGDLEDLRSILAVLYRAKLNKLQ